MPYPAWLGGGITGGGACPWGGWAPNPPIQAAEGDWLGRKKEKKKTSANTSKKKSSIHLHRNQAEPNHRIDKKSRYLQEQRNKCYISSHICKIYVLILVLNFC